MEGLLPLLPPPPPPLFKGKRGSPFPQIVDNIKLPEAYLWRNQFNQTNLWSGGGGGEQVEVFPCILPREGVTSYPQLLQHFCICNIGDGPYIPRGLIFEVILQYLAFSIFFYTNRSTYHHIFLVISSTKYTTLSTSKQKMRLTSK